MHSGHHIKRPHQLVNEEGFVEDVLQTFEEIAAQEDKELWRKAIDEERTGKEAELCSELSKTDLGELMNEDGMGLTQTAYLNELLERFDMADYYPVKTPMEDNSAENIVEKKTCKELVRCLMCIMFCSRHDSHATASLDSKVMPLKLPGRGLREYCATCGECATSD